MIYKIDNHDQLQYLLPRFESMGFKLFGFFVANGLLRLGLSGWVYLVDAQLHPRCALYFSEMAVLAIYLEIFGAFVFSDLGSWHICIWPPQFMLILLLPYSKNVAEFVRNHHAA